MMVRYVLAEKHIGRRTGNWRSFQYLALIDFVWLYGVGYINLEGNESWAFFFYEPASVL